MTFKELMVKGSEAILAKSYDQAANYFESAIQLQPNSAYSHICLVMAKIQLTKDIDDYYPLLNELDFAEDLIARDVSTDSPFKFDLKAEIEFLRGRCCFFIGIRDKKYKKLATEHWRKALEINPEHDRARQFLDTYGVKTSGCFIATAAYGNYNSPEVLYLSAFRDDVLKRTHLGRKFVNLYYTVSPCLAETISKFKKLQMISRVILFRPLIFVVQKIRRSL